MEQTTPSQMPKPRRRFRWKRWLLLAFCIVVVLASLPFANEYYARWEARRDLEKAIAALDQSDPRWRLEDIEADRKEVPAEKNSAPILIAAYRLLPKEWSSETLEELASLAPVYNLQEEQFDRLLAELQPLRPALKKAKELKDYPIGRHDVRFSSDWISTSSVDQFNVGSVATILGMEATLYRYLHETDKWWQTTQALVNCARSLGDDPRVVSIAVRRRIVWQVTDNLERMLGSWELTGEQLTFTQQVVESEIATQQFQLALRGERAGMHRFFLKVDAGEIGLLYKAFGNDQAETRKPLLLEQLAEFFETSTILRAHETLLDYHTQVIEAWKLPLIIRYRTISEIARKMEPRLFSPDKKEPNLALKMTPVFTHWASWEQWNLSRYSCAIAALAAERFRSQNKRWPESLNELVKAGILKEVPLDHFDGNPVRFRRTADGVTIYSVGKFLAYDGTALDVKPNGVIESNDPDRIEFRLWDVAHRRKTPPPRPKMVEP